MRHTVSSKTLPCILAAAALFLTAAAAAPALDLGVDFTMGNLGFDPARTASDKAFPGTGTYLDPYVWGLNLYGSQALAENIRFEAGFSTDPLLRNISYTLFSYSEKIITIGVGPFFGFFNVIPGTTWTILKPGISTAVKVEIPGIVFVRFRSDSSIGSDLTEAGSYLQERSEVGAGFYVPNAICSVAMETKKFTQMASVRVVDSLTSYSFRTEVFQKNVPYQFAVTFAYQILSKSFFTTPATVNTLGSVVVGPEITLPVSSFLTLRGNFEGSVYNLGADNLASATVMAPFLFRGTVGVKVNIDTIASFSKLF